MPTQQTHYLVCADFADRLVDLSDGELPADERIAVETHVATCAGCRSQLQRLDASLAALRAGIVGDVPVAAQPRRRVAGQLAIVAVGGTAAAIVLALGIASLLEAPTSGPNQIAPTSGPSHIAATSGRADSVQIVPHRQSPRAIAGGVPGTATNGRGFGAGDPLRRIALLEQQARLEMSLDLMPDDPWFAEQRATNEQLLTTFREATSAAGAINHTPNKAPNSKETL